MIHHKVLENEQSPNYTESTYGLAEVLKMQGKYVAAIQEFNNYLLINPDSTATTHQEAKAQIQACNWAIELTKIYDKDLVIQHLKSAVNTDFSDFSPYPYEDELLYSSLQFIPEGKKNKSNKKYSKILAFKEGDAQPTTFDLGLADETSHTAHVAFNKAGNQLFFSVCQYAEGSQIQCKIYTRKKLDATNWGPAQMLSEQINPEGVTTTQPAIGYDKSQDKEILFFVSDRLGGLGGTDLWMAYLDNNGQATNPLNIKELNTPKDEMSPFFHDYTQTLYFSSNGRISLGGHDIYKAALVDKKWEKITHTGFPLNSSYNDVDFTLNQVGSEGYFASNRAGTRFLDKQISACCYDIFKAEFNSYLLDLNVLTFSQDGEEIEDLTEVTVTLYEVFKDAEQEKFHKVEPIGNTHIFSINSNKKYKIVAKKNDYFPTEVEFNTTGPLEGNVMIQKAYLQPLKLNVLTFSDEPPQGLDGVNVQLLLLDENNKETVIDSLYDPIGNRHFFPLKSNQRYKIIGKKGDFKDATLSFNTNAWESDTPILTKKIILERPEEVIKILNLNPFSLFFDNNLPFPNEVNTTTDIVFSDALETYRNRKEEYQAEYAKGTSGDLQLQKIAEVTDFFDIQMDTNYTEFLKFTNSTLRRLKFGRGITITVRAYASPLASEAYNLALTKRRISSILNFFGTYKGGEMAKYVEEGLVKIVLEPLGESTAPKSVSDNPNDKQSSVYSPAASRQRRVEVIGADSVKSKKSPSTNSLE